MGKLLLISRLEDCSTSQVFGPSPELGPMHELGSQGRS